MKSTHNPGWGLVWWMLDDNLHGMYLIGACETRAKDHEKMG